MLRHLLKLIWKRKARNLMLTLEILLAFLVLFAIAAFGTRNYELYHLPTGFDWHNQWAVRLRATDLKNDAVLLDQFKRALLSMPEVEKVAFTSFGTYEMSRWTSDYARSDGSHRVNVDGLAVTDDFFEAMDMKLVEGRWFSAIDDGADAAPVVINRILADQLFPGQKAAGQVFVESDPNSTSAPARYRVTGVVDAFRSQGEYMDPHPFMLPRFIPGVGNEPASVIMLKVRPGTPRAFESRLSARLKQVRGDWNYVITPQTEARRWMLRMQMLPLMILSVIAAFLLVMVAFGLFGVLWQNTTQRIPEIGLRRALGASAKHIYQQIVAEQLLLSTGAMLIALVLLVQLPLTGVFGDSLNWKVFVIAAALSASVIYLLSLLCSLYPGWRAARLSPTQALHYE
ncbi:putative ABC transport system permease protein [Duganella sp. 1224]|uniref:ABC transporter permease n=1 Tax=Duganella sp. 1224 TaxID=2587052 RepID=UPI0015C9E32A|nr:FtsX-like permease family protein [Duganella sp. 1224]NYE61170.1 putative ABC transport system permease protein [Duganella sp. 1224]